jgi:Predicted periplasmic protein (DUF2092)
MGQTLRAEQFSFRAHTIRVYSEANGEPLHIFHAMKVTGHRPNRLLAEMTGDDGSNKLVFDGKTLTVFSAQEKKYVSILVPEGPIDGMLREAVGHIRIDFPLADFLSDAPDKAFLTGVTAGRVVDAVTIDGVPCDHLFFLAAARHRARALAGKERSVAAAAANRYLSITAWPTQLHRAVRGLGFHYPPVRRGFCLSVTCGRGAGAIEAGRGAASQTERRHEMTRFMVVSLSLVLMASAAPNALGWGYHGGGFSGGSYHGAYGGSFSRSGGSWSATGARGSTASGGGGSWNASGFRGSSASGGGGSWSGHGAYGGTASGGGGSWSATGRYGGTAYGGYGGYHGAYYGGYNGGYYGGTAVVTPGYAGYGAAAVAGAAVGAAATSAAYAAASTNYYPPPYYQPPAW